MTGVQTCALPISPPLTTKSIVQEEEWCLASNKKETPGKQKQRNSLTQHMNNNSNPTGSTGKTPWSATNLLTPPAPTFPRSAATITSANQRNGVHDASKRVETASILPQQQKQLPVRPSTTTTPVNSRANGWNLASSSLSKNNTVGGLQRLSPSPAQQQQQRGSRAQSDLQSTIPAALPPTSIPVAAVWPSLTKGETLAKNASVNSGSTGTNSTTKTPIVTGAWAARASKS